MLDHITFGNALRHALNCLDDSEALGHSPLLEWLGLKGQDHPAQALRQALEQAIAAFRPASEATPDSKAWRHYQILFGRYIQRLTQEALANRLAITPRHLRREQAAALQALEEYLRLRYDLPPALQEFSSPPGETRNAELNREMRWLVDSMRDRVSEVQSVLTEVVGLAQSLAQQRAAVLNLSCTHALPLVAVPPTILKQIILNLLVTILRNVASGARIRLFADAAEGHVVILITSPREGPTWQCLEATDQAVAMARRLLTLFGGKLILSEVNDLLIAKALLPLEGRCVTVLAIEDNLDTLQLWQRYVQGTRFSLIEETDPAQALTRAAALHPDLIVLDVMLPDIDGWKLLRQLREHPATARTPIIVCTVLPQKDLALALGADDFIQKPTTGKEFRAALERQSVAATRSR